MLKVKKVLEESDPSISVVEDRPMEYLGDHREEPFLLQPRTDNERADYEAGFCAGKDGKRADDTETSAWQKGWAEAQG